MSAGLQAQAAGLVIRTGGRKALAGAIEQIAGPIVFPLLSAAGATCLQNRLPVRNRKAARRGLQGSSRSDRPGFRRGAHTSSYASCSVPCSALWCGQTTAVLVNIRTLSRPMLPWLTCFGYDHNDVASAAS